MDSLLTHLMAEEQQAIAHAPNLLTAADGSAVAAIAAERDPLFGSICDSHYSELRRQLRRELGEE